MKSAEATGTEGEAGAPRRDKSHVHRRIAFFTIALTLLMTSIDSTIVATVLLTLQRDLKTSVNWAAWTITAYSFGRVVMLPVSGKLSEWYGHGKVFLASVVLFTVASLCCGLTDNIFVLIVLRTLQAAGGAGFTPSATGIIVRHFGNERDRAVSLFGSIYPIGAMIGPIFGGLFVTYWTWRGAFFVNVPIGILVALLSLHYIPMDRPQAGATKGTMDMPGLAMMAIGLLAGMAAISFLGEKNGSAESLPFLVPLVIAIAAVIGFFRHVSRAAQPFIAIHLIIGRYFGAVNLINMIYGGVTIGGATLIPLYAADRYGISALDSGTLLIAQGIATVAFSVGLTVIIRRTGYRLPLYLGGGIIAVGMLLLAVHPAFGISPYLWLAGAAFVIGVGDGMLNPASRNAGLQLAPEHSSTLAALRSLALQVGSIVTVSLVATIIAHSNSAGAAQALVYAFVPLLFLIASPLISRVPEHHGSW